jgi:hypothetical protein
LCHLVEDHVRAHGGDMVIYTFTSGDVPFQETDEGTTAAQMRR